MNLPDHNNPFLLPAIPKSKRKPEQVDINPGNVKTRRSIEDMEEAKTLQREYGLSWQEALEVMGK